MCAHDRGIECFRMTILEQHVIGLAVPRFDPLSPVIDQTGSILATIFVRIRRRRKLIPVFGWTDPDSKVMVTFRGKHFFGMAGANGFPVL